MSRKTILLHGAVGSSDQLLFLVQELKNSGYGVFCFEFPGHGKTGIFSDHFSIEGFADALKMWMNESDLKGAEVFGYSMGGFVALYLAALYPEYFSRITTLGTKFDWTEEIAEKEVKMLDAEKIAEKVPAFAKELESRHTAIGWRKNLELTSAMMRSLGKKNVLTEKEFAQIKIPVCILLGDSDKMVTREESENAAGKIHGAEFMLLENTPHPIEKVNIAALMKVLVGA
ncbi:MAG TPA: alpha/beta fold hydrolase [Bacteroidia bacterium]|jgi:pimeloyl-ACP methyl ester carboxylesterase|nr:alpha/beta fold hydrolase [Bacteroidia bacterium]